MGATDGEGDSLCARCPGGSDPHYLSSFQKHPKKKCPTAPSSEFVLHSTMMANRRYRFAVLFVKHEGKPPSSPPPLHPLQLACSPADLHFRAWGPQMDQVAPFTAAANNENFFCSPSSDYRLIPTTFPGRGFMTEIQTCTCFDKKDSVSRQAGPTFGPGFIHGTS